MKTAKEWCESSKIKTAWLNEKDVEEIQLDALNHGISLALNIAELPHKITTAEAVRKMRSQIDELRELIGK